MKPRVIATIMLCALTLAGCASSGVYLVGSGDETYLVRTQDDIGVIGYARPLLTDLHRESQAFCLRTGRAAETVNESESRGLPLLSGTSAELKFRCVAI